MNVDQTRFENLNDLARLPYFEVRDGLLTLADPSLGPTIDLHTHLALTFGVRKNVDLLREWPETEHYLPAERALDLDVYLNRCFSETDMARLTHDLSLGALRPGGMRRTHTIPNLAREMRALGVRHSVLLPIEWPVLSRNAEDWMEAARGREDFVSFGSVHPFDPRLERRLDAQKAAGARGVKVHPAVQLVPPDHDRCMHLYRLCGARNLAVFWHCGPVDIETGLGRRYSQVYRYERALAEVPETTFVLGHSGALQPSQALDFAQRYPNAWMELASQSMSGIRRLLEHAPTDRIVFGSDWPFYSQAIGLAKVYLLTESAPALRRALLYDNAARLLGAAVTGAPPG
jgi:predicted TIM-barrel fold metal-dependent hydrolase